jgi:group II intron reverse transcriptase/maturase
MNDAQASEEQGMSRVRTFQRKLYRAAKQSATRGFGILYDKVGKWEVLTAAWYRVCRKQGAAGVDGQSIQWICEEYGEERFLREIQKELESQTYRPEAIRRVYIPKADGSTRPLGIPTVKDRVIQMAVKMVIEPLFEADFKPCSYGFRPKRSNREAVQRVHQLVNHRKWVVDVDLKSYFDTIPHERLMKLVGRRVRDRRVLHLIRLWLKAGIMEEGEVRYGTSGTPQGGVLSPLLSNIYLHELDRQWDETNGQLIRFADDVVILCVSREQAERALMEVRRMVSELELTLNEQKTKLGHIRQGFDFLGFTFREGYSQKCKRRVRVKYPRSKSMQKVRDRIKTVIRNHLLGTPLPEVIGPVNQTLRGWAAYFKIGNSYAASLQLSGYVCDQLRLFWRRCKHRKRIRGSCRWPNGFFYNQGLCYVPRLIRA